MRLSASANGTRNVYDITKNMVVDYSADNTGVASVTAKYFTDLKADIQGQKARVISPAGTYNFATFGGSSFINGAEDVTLNNTGATWTGSFFLATDHIGQIGIDEASGKSARIQTVSPGATSVELTAESASAGHISRFSVGQYMLVCGWPIQAGFQSAYSFPPNWQWHEYRKITSIVGNTLHFAEALENYYSADWPEINRGGAFEVDAAGSASIFAISLFWNGTTTVNGGSYDNENLINCYRENFIINGGESVDLPIYPSVTKLFRAVNHTATAALVEHDKLIDLADIQGGNYSQWKCQSSSTKLLQFDGTTIGSFNGTAGNTVLDDCVVTGGAILGAIAYGRCTSFIARNTSFGGAITGGLVEKGPNDGVSNDVGVQGYMFMSAGVITVPLCMGDSATRTLMPDASGNHVLHWWGLNGTIGAFKVLSVTSDPWPAADDQTSTTDVTIANGSKNLEVSTGIFTSGDVGKVIIIPSIQSSSGTMRTFITGFTDSQHVTLYHACTGAGVTAASRALQWGTCNMYVTTDQAGGLPPSGLWGSGGTKLWISVPPVRSLRLENCTGTAQVLDLSQPAAWDRPLYEYTKRTYDGSTSHSGAPSIQLIGNVVSIKVNVITPYTGSQGTLNMGFSRFNNLQKVASGDSAYSSYAARFNLKIAGERVITVGSTTGAQSLDANLDISTATWFGTSYQASISQDISAENPSVWPEFTIEWILDQGFP